MMPVEEGKTWLALLPATGQLPANLLAGRMPGFARSAVGIARIHDHRAHAAAAGRERGPSDLERRGYYAILREHGGRSRARGRLRPAPGQAGRWP